MRRADRRGRLPGIWGRRAEAYSFGSQLGPDDPELPNPLVNALFGATDDPVLRFRVADVVLRHLGLAIRLARGDRTLHDMPASWPRGRLLRLTEPSGHREGLEEITLILLQIANKPAMRLLGALRREVPQLVEGRLTAVTGREGAELTDLIGALG